MLLSPDLCFKRLALVLEDADAPTDVDEDALGRLYLLKRGLGVVDEIVQVLHVQKMVAPRREHRKRGLEVPLREVFVDSLLH